MNKSDLPYSGTYLNYDQLPVSGYIMPEQDVELEGKALQLSDHATVSCRVLDVYDPAFIKAAVVERDLGVSQYTESLSVCSRRVNLDSLEWAINRIQSSSGPGQRQWIAPRDWSREPWHYDNGGGVPWTISGSEYDLSCEYQTRLSGQYGEPGWLSGFSFLSNRALSAEPIRAIYRDLNKFRMKRAAGGYISFNMTWSWMSQDKATHLPSPYFPVCYGCKVYYNEYESSMAGDAWFRYQYYADSWNGQQVQGMPEWVTEQRAVYVAYLYHITVTGYRQWSGYFTQDYYATKFVDMNAKPYGYVPWIYSSGCTKEQCIDVIKNHPSLGEDYTTPNGIKSVMENEGMESGSYMEVYVDVQPDYVFSNYPMQTDLTEWYG